MNNLQAKTLTRAKQVQDKTALPASWLQAAGLLQHKKRALAQHIKQVRTEWGRAAVSR